MKNCKEIEKDIYLYDELSVPERTIMDAHISGCRACQELFAAVQLHQAAIQKAVQQKPQPENYSKLTRSIMRAIEEKENKSVFSEFFERLFVRYALGAVSLALILTFVIEQSHSKTAQVQLTEVTHSPKTVTLETSGILKNIRSKKKSETSFYACVKSGSCNIPLFKTLN